LKKATTGGRFRLKRSGGRWFIEGLGILRCAQDDGRNRQKQGKDEGIIDGGMRCGKERWYAGVRRNGGVQCGKGKHGREADFFTAMLRM
jgi:hypothetical protein